MWLRLNGEDKVPQIIWLAATFLSPFLESSHFRQPLKPAGVLPVRSGWTWRADSEPSEVSWRSCGVERVCLSVCLFVCLSAAAVAVCLGYKNKTIHPRKLIFTASTVWRRHPRLWTHRCPPVIHTERRYSVGCSSAQRRGGGGGGIPIIFRLPGEIIIWYNVCGVDAWVVCVKRVIRRGEWESLFVGHGQRVCLEPGAEVSTLASCS